MMRIPPERNIRFDLEIGSKRLSRTRNQLQIRQSCNIEKYLRNLMREVSPERGWRGALHVAGQHGWLVLLVGVKEVLLAQLGRFRGKSGV